MRRDTLLLSSGASPAGLYADFVLVEFLMLLVLIPLTWTAIVRRLRRLEL